MPPLHADRDRWTDRADYRACQDLADGAREAGLNVLKYASARIATGVNLALLTCGAFLSRQPRSVRPGACISARTVPAPCATFPRRGWSSIGRRSPPTRESPRSSGSADVSGRPRLRSPDVGGRKWRATAWSRGCALGCGRHLCVVLSPVINRARPDDCARTGVRTCAGAHADGDGRLSSRFHRDGASGGDALSTSTGASRVTATEDLADHQRRDPGELRRAVLRADERRARASRPSSGRPSCQFVAAAAAFSARTARPTRSTSGPSTARSSAPTSRSIPGRSRPR